LGTDAKPQLVKINAQLETCKMLEEKQLLKEFKNVGRKTIIEGIQKCFCMDIQRSKRDFTKVGTTQN
jgi:hypothetical protein